MIYNANYYPYGMLMDGRHGSSGSQYRYGFQGQEMDDEVKGKGNSVNYKYRMHNPRVGRFFAVDPLAPKYPHYSPYSFSGNKVIHRVELEGLEDISYQKKVDGKLVGVTELRTATSDEIKAYSGQFGIQSKVQATWMERWRITYHFQDGEFKGTGFERWDEEGNKLNEHFKKYTFNFNDLTPEQRKEYALEFMKQSISRSNSLRSMVNPVSITADFLENGTIVATGKDWSGEQRSRWAAGGMMALDIVPGTAIGKGGVKFIGRGYRTFNRFAATKYLRMTNQIDNFATVDGFSLSLGRKYQYVYHSSEEAAKTSKWFTTTNYSSPGSAFNGLALDYPGSRNVASFQYRMRGIGFSVKGTAAPQGISSGGGVQYLRVGPQNTFRVKRTWGIQQ